MARKPRTNNGSWGFGPLDGDTQLEWLSGEFSSAALIPIANALSKDDRTADGGEWRPAAHALVVLHDGGLIWDEQAAALAELADQRLAEVEAAVPNWGWVDEDAVYASLQQERAAVRRVAEDLQGRGTGFGAHIGKVVEEIERKRERERQAIKRRVLR